MDKQLKELLAALLVGAAGVAVIYLVLLFAFWNVVWAVQVWQREVMQCTS